MLTGSPPDTLTGLLAPFASCFHLATYQTFQALVAGFSPNPARAPSPASCAAPAWPEPDTTTTPTASSPAPAGILTRPDSCCAT
jgi:hypothetical protein